MKSGGTLGCGDRSASSGGGNGGGNGSCRRRRRRLGIEAGEFGGKWCCHGVPSQVTDSCGYGEYVPGIRLQGCSRAQDRFASVPSQRQRSADRPRRAFKKNGCRSDGGRVERFGKSYPHRVGQRHIDGTVGRRNGEHRRRIDRQCDVDRHDPFHRYRSVVGPAIPLRHIRGGKRERFRTDGGRVASPAPRHGNEREIVGRNQRPGKGVAVYPRYGSRCVTEPQFRFQQQVTTFGGNAGECNLLLAAVYQVRRDQSTILGRGNPRESKPGASKHVYNLDQQQLSVIGKPIGHGE